MRLLNPSPGEIFDRLSILELKITVAKKKGLEASYFEAEKASLEERMLQWTDGLVFDHMGAQEALDKKKEEISTQRNTLAAVNGLLWMAEDDARAASENEAFKLARLCKQIVKWNDARAGAVRELDRLYGITDGPEKLYSVSSK
jgi:hypothetical protein